MGPLAGATAALTPQQGSTSYAAVPKAGGYDFFRVVSQPWNTANPQQFIPITREQYVSAGYQDPTASEYNRINIDTPEYYAANRNKEFSRSGGVIYNFAGEPIGSYDLGTKDQTQNQMATQQANAMAAQQAAALAAQQAAALRAEEVKRSGLRSGIQSLIGQAGDIYRNLYGGLSRAGESQKQQLEKTYGEGLQTLGETYTAELPKIAQAYAARGAYDSTWRAGAEQEAQKGYESQLKTMRTAQEEALGKLGQALAESRGQFQAGESALQTVLGRLGDVTDINELTALRNEIENKIGSLRQAEAGQLTREQQLAEAAGVAGIGDKFTQAQRTIQTIVAGQAPAPLKRSIASQIIINSDLTDQEKQALQSQVNQIA